jgi:hypothetical protein
VRCAKVDNAAGAGQQPPGVGAFAPAVDRCKTRTALLLACCAGTLIVGGSARAQETLAPALNWVRLEDADSCLSSAQLAQRVEATVGRKLFTSPSDGGLSVDGHVWRAGRGWHVRLAVSEPGGATLGRRDMLFEGEACSVIDEGVTLVIAVTLYPNSGLADGGIPLDPRTSASLESLFGAEPTDPDPQTLPTPDPPPTPTDAPRPTARTEVSAAPRVRTAPWSLGLDLAAHAGFGRLPGVAAGAGGYVLIAPPSGWTFQAGAQIWPARTATAQDAPGRARFDLMLGSIALCPFEPTFVRALALCGGAEIGRLRVEPSGFASRNRATSDVVVNLLALALWRPQLVGSLHLRAALALDLPLVQHSYTFQTLDRTQATLFRMPQIAAHAELGLALQL